MPKEDKFYNPTFSLLKHNECLFAVTQLFNIVHLLAAQYVNDLCNEPEFAAMSQSSTVQEPNIWWKFVLSECF